MKIGIFSDVHGNVDSLQAVLDAMAQEGVTRFWCLGDIVGYGANPNECVARVREVAEVVVLGNHDAACVGAEDIAHFNQYARDAVLWTQRQLLPEHRDWLKRLPLTESVERMLLVHASPFEPSNWHYVHTRMQVGEMRGGFNATQARCAFVGHSHQAMILVKKGDEFFRFLGEHLRLEDGSRYLVNVGSTGQPRDGNPKAAYALYDTEADTITLVRAAYDIAAAQRKIREAGLPDILADRLETGS